MAIYLCLIVFACIYICGGFALKAVFDTAYGPARMNPRTALCLAVWPLFMALIGVAALAISAGEQLRNVVYIFRARPK